MIDKKNFLSKSRKQFLNLLFEVGGRVRGVADYLDGRLVSRPHGPLPPPNEAVKLGASGRI